MSYLVASGTYLKSAVIVDEVWCILRAMCPGEVGMTLLTHTAAYRKLPGAMR